MLLCWIRGWISSSCSNEVRSGSRDHTKFCIAQYHHRDNRSILQLRRDRSLVVLCLCAHDDLYNYTRVIHVQSAGCFLLITCTVRMFYWHKYTVYPTTRPAYIEPKWILNKYLRLPNYYAIAAIKCSTAISNLHCQVSDRINYVVWYIIDRPLVHRSTSARS